MARAAQRLYGVRVRVRDKPAAFADRLRRFLYRHAYDQARAEAAEREKFRRLDFDLGRAYGAVDEVLADLGKPSFSSQRGMASMHWVLFACVAQRFEVRRILEIGTYDGETTLLLSRLFPAADITTLDLPEDDPVFAQSYAREDPAERVDQIWRWSHST